MAKRPAKQPRQAQKKQAPQEPKQKILRIGVIQAGKIVEERLVRRREDVTIGASAQNTIVVPASTLPKTFTLFERSGGKYQMIFSDTMDGRVSLGDQVLALEQIRSQGKAQQKGKGLLSIPLTESSRGKIMLGEITLLFQFVAPPPIQPRPQLPPSVRGGIVGSLDMLFGSSLGGVALIAAVFVGWVHTLDLDTELAPDAIPDDFAEYVPTVEEKKPEIDMSKLKKVGDDKKKKEKSKKVAKKKSSAGKKTKRRGPAKKKAAAPPCDDACKAAKAAARRARLREQVMRQGILQEIGAKGGAGQTTKDLLKGGNPGSTAKDAFKGVGGTRRGGGRGGNLKGKGGGGTGRAAGIGELGGRVGGPGKVGVGGKVEEKVPRAIVKRAAPPEVDSTLKSSAVARVIRRGMRAISSCYQRGLKRDPSLSGKIGIRLTIAATGKVTDVEIEKDTIGDSGVAKCIKGYAKRWRFPPPEGGGVAEVAVPFVFKAAK